MVENWWDDVIFINQHKPNTLTLTVIGNSIQRSKVSGKIREVLEKYILDILTLVNLLHVAICCQHVSKRVLLNTPLFIHD